MSDRPLVPRLGDEGSMLQQLGRLGDALLELLRGIEAKQLRKPLSLQVAPHSPPERDDAVFGQAAHAPVVVDQGASHHGVRLVIGDQSQGQHGRPSRLPPRTCRQPLQRPDGVMPRNVADKIGGLLTDDILPVKRGQQRNTRRSTQVRSPYFSAILKHAHAARDPLNIPLPLSVIKHLKFANQFPFDRKPVARPARVDAAHRAQEVQCTAHALG
jgi:hypothetical protein